MTEKELRAFWFAASQTEGCVFTPWQAAGGTQKPCNSLPRQHSWPTEAGNKQVRKGIPERRRPKVPFAIPCHSKLSPFQTHRSDKVST